MKHNQRLLLSIAWLTSQYLRISSSVTPSCLASNTQSPSNLRAIFVKRCSVFEMESSTAIIWIFKQLDKNILRSSGMARSSSTHYKLHNYYFSFESPNTPHRYSKTRKFGQYQAGTEYSHNLWLKLAGTLADQRRIVLTQLWSLPGLGMDTAAARAKFTFREHHSINNWLPLHINVKHNSRSELALV